MRLLNALILALVLLAPPASGITVSRVTDFEAGTPAEAEEVDAELDNILAAINGNLDGANITNGSIATNDLATASVTTAKINDGAVTRTKLEAVGQQISSSSGTFHLASNVEAAVTNLTASLTTSGRPVWVGLQSAGGVSAPGSVRYRNNGGSATDNAAHLSFRRASATINQVELTGRNITNSTNDVLLVLPCSDFWFLDTPSSGTLSYEVYARTATGDDGMITVQNCKLVVFEL